MCNIEVYTKLACCIAATMQCVGVTQWEEVDDINDIEVASKEAILFSYIFICSHSSNNSILPAHHLLKNCPLSKKLGLTQLIY